MNAQKQTSLIERPPIVAVLGHVDHGKSTLLDFIRKSNTVAKEAGGITQHVAAYEVVHKAKKITFIDTPGHAAFGAIRARGATVADIAILVVAADDGVKAQTLEALESIRESKTPFIVAINKIDKPNANLERTQASLMENGVFLDKLGGDVSWTAISAKTGESVEELLDLILLVAELQEIKGDTSLPAQGFVLEAHRDQKRGIASTLIITNGSLHSGMAIVAGGAIAPVRIMEDHIGKSLKEASFSSPVTIVGFDALPETGEAFDTFKNKRDAEEAREKQIAAAPRIASKEQVQNDERYYLPLIIRADTSGSLEAIEHELIKLGDEHSGISIALSGIGTISENDVKAALAGASHAVLVGFNVGIDPIAETRAREQGLAVETFDIIYKLTERLEERLATARPKRTVEATLGRAKILKQFSSHKDEHVVGGKVIEGYIARGATVRVIRRFAPIGIGKLRNIQSNKQNVDRVEKDNEFGAQIEASFEVAQGDTIECFTTTIE